MCLGKCARLLLLASCFSFGYKRQSNRLPIGRCW